MRMEWFSLSQELIERNVINFQRRMLRCWIDESEWNNYNSSPPILSFENTEDLRKFIRSKLPWSAEGYDDTVTITEDGTVVYWTVIGWIT